MPEPVERDLPSSVSGNLDFFDRFAGRAASFVSRAPFFAASVFLVIAWLIEGIVLISMKGFKAFIDETYQLQINTLTTIVTFLLVALLQNTQSRSDEAMHEKLNAIADALGDLMTNMEPTASQDMQKDVEELRDAVGLEDKVGADDSD